MNFSAFIDLVMGGIERVSGGNQMVAGAISLWMLGVMSYLFRRVPNGIKDVLVKHLTTQLTTTSQHITFFSLLEWIEAKGYSDKLRRIKLSNGRNGGFYGDGNLVKTVGYGNHIIWYKCRPILLSLTVKDTLGSDDKEQITLSKLGRSHAILDALVKEATVKADDNDSTKIYKYGKSWSFLGKQPKRSMSSVVIPQADVDTLIRTLREFKANEEWFNKHGIPYQLGILIYGPPGTGKTSLIKAIAGHVDKALCMASTSSLMYVEDMLHTAPADGIVVIEDIDTSNAVKSRTGIRTVPGIREPEPGLPECAVTATDERHPAEPAVPDTEPAVTKFDWSMASLSEILNAIDGVISSHGRILIMTTNHPEKIDKALLRPGRIDLKLKVGYMCYLDFKHFLRKFFDDIPDEELAGRELNTPTLTGSTLQGDTRMGMKWEALIEKYTKIKE